MVDKDDLFLALYANFSRGYNASAQRLVTSIFGWLAYIAFISKDTVTQSLMPSNIELIISIILFSMSTYFWLITCYIGINIRYIENNINFGSEKMIEIVKKLPWKNADRIIGWTGPKTPGGFTIGECVTLVIILLIYFIPIKLFFFPDIIQT